VRRASLAAKLEVAQARQERLEAEARRLRELDASATVHHRGHDSDTQDSGEDGRPSHSFTTQAEINSVPRSESPPAPQNSARQEISFKPVQGTQGFSPRSAADDDSDLTLTTNQRESSKVTERSSLRQQQTEEEVDDIQEEVEGPSDNDKDKDSSDDQFNF